MKKYKDGRTHTEYAREWAKAHPEQVAARKRRWQQQNRDKVRNAHLVRTYGITLEEYTRLLHQQQSACAVCGFVPGPDDRGLVVDHCHDTGEVRGLLCNNCNTGIGLLQDNPQVVEAAAMYLRRYK